jgi:transposase
MIRLTDEQWERIRDHFPEENIADGRPGRKPIPTRCVLEAVLWILNTGAQWHMLLRGEGPRGAILLQARPKRFNRAD